MKKNVPVNAAADTYVDEGFEYEHFKSIKSLLNSSVTQKIMVQIAYFFMGVLSSRATVFGGYSPFGAAIVAASPFRNMIATTIGTLIGCLMPSPVKNDVRYIATILAVAALKWVLNDFKALREHPLFAPLIAAVPIFATGIVLSIITSSYDGTAMVVTVIETLMACGAAFFFCATTKIFAGTRGITALTFQELACVALCACIALLALSGITVGTISIGRILSVILILFCGYYAGVPGGAISGISLGAILSFATTDISYISGAFAFGGLMCGMFSKLGKIFSVIGFILANGIIVLQTGNSALAMSCLIEVAIATVVFMIIPKRLGDKVGRVFDPGLGYSNISGLKSTVIMRMDFASKTLSDVSGCVKTITKKLKKLYIPDINGVYKASSESVCSKCNLKLVCWERDFNDTMNVFNDTTVFLKEHNEIKCEDFPDHFKNRCARLPDLTQSINANYKSYLSNNEAQNRIDEVGSVVHDQFYSMSEILTDFTKELKVYDRFDFITNEQIKTLLEEYNIDVIDVSSRIDKFEHMTIEIEARKKDCAKLFKKKLLDDIESICDRKLDSPCISTTPQCTRIQISEKADFSVNVGAYQHTCNNARLCGDSYKYFNDGMGRMVAIISDGMGTGGRAAVDSAMASGILEKLAKSGLSFDCALRLLNSALLVKSGEESLATIDVVRINLFTGATEFKKAGAAFTYVRHHKRVMKIDLPSLPAGILTQIKFSKKKVDLCKGDAIVLVSDGVTASGDDWIEHELLKWEGELSEKEFAQKIVEQAQFRRSDGHDDDITALVMTVN